MRAGPIDGVIRATWPSGIVVGPFATAGDDERQRLEVGDHAARLRRQPDGDVARLAGRIDPVADVDAGKRRPQRLRHLADRDAERTGEAAIDLHVELRLLPLGRQADVDRAGHLRAPRQRSASASVASSAAFRPLQLQLDLLLPVVEAGADRRRHAAQLRQVARGCRRRPPPGLRERSVLRRQLDEDRALRRPPRPGRRPSCRCRPPRIACGRCARPPAPSAACRPGSSRAASRSQTVNSESSVSGAKPAPTQPVNGSASAADQACATASATIADAMVERPRDHALVALGPTVEPLVEAAEHAATATAAPPSACAGRASRPTASGRARTTRTATPAPSRRWSARTA